MRRTAALFCAAVLAAAPAFAQEAAPQSATIPLKPRPDGADFPNFVTVQVGGGRPGNVLLDTGSTGLRIRAEAVGPGVQLTDIPVTYPYFSGNVLTGVLGYALVSFPGSNPLVATPKPIAVQVVQSITCTPEITRCPGWPPGQIGVMGVGYAPLAIFNPLAQLSGNLGSGFIVAANDRTNRAVVPQVVVGLTPQNSAGFARAPFTPENGKQPEGLKAWGTKSVSTCFSVNGGPPGCQATVFDTGAPAGSFLVPGLEPERLNTPVKRGDKITTEVKGVMSLTISADRQAWTNRYRYKPARGTPEHFNSGAQVFRHFKVLFDAEKGEIGFSRAPR